MLNGIGVDILKIGYIDKMINKYGDYFLTKHFTKTEIKNARLKKRRANEYFAGRYAAKEALIKALSVFKDINLPTFEEIEIINKTSGQPVINILKERLKKRLSGSKIYVSISHHEEYTISFVCIYSLKN